MYEKGLGVLRQLPLAFQYLKSSHKLTKAYDSALDPLSTLGVYVFLKMVKGTKKNLASEGAASVQPRMRLITSLLSSTQSAVVPILCQNARAKSRSMATYSLDKDEPSVHEVRYPSMLRPEYKRKINSLGNKVLHEPPNS
jgi:hypothetical protein